MTNLSVPHAFVPGAFVADGGKITNDERFVEGQTQVMDPGSALVALLVDAKPGERIIDLCAAPGSKTMLLAQAVGEHGCVIAVENNAKRAKKIQDNAVRMGMSARVEIQIADAVDLATAPGDAVLVDAPCSGFGTTRRKPEILFRRGAEDVARNAEKQRMLLRTGARLTKPGGALVYAVCSPLPAEGIDVVREFLREDAAFSLEDPRDVLPWLPADAVVDRCVHLFPHLHDSDAFFVARLRRRKESP